MKICCLQGESKLHIEKINWKWFETVSFSSDLRHNIAGGRENQFESFTWSINENFLPTQIKVKNFKDKNVFLFALSYTKQINILNEIRFVLKLYPDKIVNG